MGLRENLAARIKPFLQRRERSNEGGNEETERAT